MTWRDGVSGCSSSRSVRVDQLDVRVYYNHDQTTTTTTIEEVPVADPDGTDLAPQDFWGAMQSQGAPDIQGDAYMTYYDDRTSELNGDYDPDKYCHYGVQFPSGASNDEVWLFDAGFCHVDPGKGTSESWNTDSSYGYSPHQPVSSFYDLYDTRNTPYQTSDDVLVASSGNTFKSLSPRDPDLDVQNPLTAGDCSALGWHNGWPKLADGLSGNRTYRVHTRSTDPSSASAGNTSDDSTDMTTWEVELRGSPVHLVLR